MVNKEFQVKTNRKFWKTIRPLLRNEQIPLENKRILLKNKRVIPGNKRVLLENERAILENKGTVLEIKRHFWKVKVNIHWITRALATSPRLWCGHFWMFHAKIKFQKFSGGFFLPWVRYLDPCIS